MFTYITDSTDFGLINMATGYNCATCNLLIALPLTSSIQCLPWKLILINYNIIIISIEID